MGAMDAINKGLNVAKTLPTSNIPAISLPVLIGVNKGAAVVSKLIGEAESYVVGEVKSTIAQSEELTTALEALGFQIKEANPEHPGISSRNLGELLIENIINQEDHPYKSELDPNGIRTELIDNSLSVIDINKKVPNVNNKKSESVESKNEINKNSSKTDNGYELNPSHEIIDKTKTPTILLTRDKLLNSNSVTAYKHRWAITLEKMGAASLPNPFSSAHNKYNGDDGLVLSDNLVPATAYRYDTYKSSIEEISFLPGIAISIPTGFSLSKTLSVTLMNDCQDTVRRYLRQYRSIVCPTYKSAVPYKEACSKLVLYIYNAQLTLMNSYELYVIPDFSDEAISDQELKSLDITFYLLGESDNNPDINPFR